MERSAIYNPAVTLVLTETYIGDDLQPTREQETGQREVRGGFVSFFIIIKQ